MRPDEQRISSLTAEVEILKAQHKSTNGVVAELHTQHKETMAMVKENTEAMRESNAALTTEISHLVTEMRESKIHAEYTSNELKAIKADQKEDRKATKEFFDWVGPIAREAEKTQKLKTKMHGAIASDIGKILLGLLVAGLVFSIATTFGLSMGDN